MKVYLIGYMGVGKSTVGKRLAQRMNYYFVDLDLQIEKTENRTITELFEEETEEKFREIERRILLDETHDKSVIATGGGAPCYKNNIDKMLESGVVVWLKMMPEILLSRLKDKKATRPLIENLSEFELGDFIKKHLSEREPFYSKAHIHFDAKNMNQTKMDELEREIINYSR